MLLDTHALLWLLGDNPRLGAAAREALVNRTGAVHASAASIWEISIKAQLGKLTVPEDVPHRVEAAGLSWAPVTPAQAWAARSVTGLPHRDHFDRLLVTQAHDLGVPLLTADEALLGAELDPQVRLVDARR